MRALENISLCQSLRKGNQGQIVPQFISCCIAAAMIASQ
jgi:hypothetical protein